MSIAVRASSREAKPRYHVDPPSEILPPGSTSFKVVDTASDSVRMTRDADIDRNVNLASES